MVYDVNDHVLAPCDDDYFTCFNRRCIHNTEKCNNRNDCGDNSDEDYTHARCLGEFAVEPVAVRALHPTPTLMV